MFSKTRKRLTIYFSILMILFLLAFNMIGYLLLSTYVYRSQEKQLQAITDSYIEEEEEMIERLLDWEGEEDEEKKHKVEKEHERSERGGWEAGTLRHFYLVVDAHNRVVSDNIPLLEHPDKLMGELMAWPPRKGEYRYFTVDNYDDTEIELIFAGRQIYEDGKYRGTIYVGADVTAQKAVLRQLMFVLIGLSAFFCPCIGFVGLCDVWPGHETHRRIL